MTVKLYVFDGGTLGAAAAVQGAAVDNLTKRVIISAALTNTTGSAVAATIYLVPSGGAADAAHTVISARSIAPGETYLCPELIGQGLNAGGSVQGLGAGLSFKYSAKDIVNG